MIARPANLDNGIIVRPDVAHLAMVVDRDDINPETIAMVVGDLSFRLGKMLDDCGIAGNWETFALHIEDQPAPNLGPLRGKPTPYVRVVGEVEIL